MTYDMINIIIRNMAYNILLIDIIHKSLLRP